jgi:toxin HigB-1
VIVSFGNDGTEDVFNGKNTRVARKTCPRQILDVARRKLDMIVQAVILDDLRVPPGNRLEKLHGDRAGQHSIGINDQYRICFVWAEAGAKDVEITDYH